MKECSASYKRKLIRHLLPGELDVWSLSPVLMECSQPQLQNKQPHGRVALKTEEGGWEGSP